MYKPIAAMDDLNNPGHRILILEDKDSHSCPPGSLAFINFPEDRGTVYFENTYYDWYGRKIEVGQGITRIVRPFGYSGDSQCNIVNHCDNFIVELENGQLGIAKLDYCQPESHDPNHGGTKLRITGHTLSASPCLRLESDYYVFNEIDDDLIESTFLRILQDNTEFPLSAIGCMADGQCVFLSNHSKTTGNQFYHHITPSKSALIDFFTSTGQKSKKAEHPPSIYATNLILKGFVITENGNKITASFNYPNRDSRLVASIDRDCLKFYHDSHLYWYEDQA